MINHIQHVEVEVDDLDAAVGFYEALGLQRLERPAVLDELIAGAWLAAGSSQLHLVLTEQLATPSATNHIAFEVDDLDDATEQLRRLGVDCSDIFDTGAGLQVFFTDPSGNLLEFNQITPQGHP